MRNLIEIQNSMDDLEAYEKQLKKFVKWKPYMK